jgi:alpha-L-fucosidase
MLVDDLVDIISKNGCLLLNVGPRADGTIPRQAQEILLAIGGWLKKNGEAIYSTRPWKIFGEGPTSVAEGHLSEKKNKSFTEEDIRYTQDGKFLYATALDWPKNNKLIIRTLNSEMKVGTNTNSIYRLPIIPNCHSRESVGSVRYVHIM